mgnify:CR=1 FL=1
MVGLLKKVVVSIDWDPSGNLIAVPDQGVQIVDRRVKDVVKTIESKWRMAAVSLFFLKYSFVVDPVMLSKWSPCGQQLIATSWGPKTAILNYGTGKLDFQYQFEAESNPIN